MKCSTHKWNSSHCCGMFHTSSVWFPQYQAYSIHLAVHSVYCRHILQIGKIKWEEKWMAQRLKKGEVMLRKGDGGDMIAKTVDGETR